MLEIKSCEERKGKLTRNKRRKNMQAKSEVELIARIEAKIIAKKNVGETRAPALTLFSPLGPLSFSFSITLFYSCLIGRTDQHN